MIKGPSVFVTEEEQAKEREKAKNKQHFVYKTPSKVLPGLYVGNFRDSKDCTQLDRYNITHIVAIHDAARKIYPDKHYLCVMASDTPDQNLVQYFSVCNDFIHAARLRGGNVLIHCLAGMSRSVTVCVAYIMAVTTLNWKEALKVVRVGRSVANPNLGFQRQLEEFELTKLYEERRRLKERFPSVALVQRDEQECRLLLSSYDSLLLSKQVCEGNCAMGEECPTGICRSPTKSRDVALRRKSSLGRNTPPSSPRRLPPTPLGRSPSVVSAYSIGSLTRGSAMSRIGRLGNSAPPSPSVSRHDLSCPSLSAPVSPSRRQILQPRPPLL